MLQPLPAVADPETENGAVRTQIVQMPVRPGCDAPVVSAARRDAARTQGAPNIDQDPIDQAQPAQPSDLKRPWALRCEQEGVGAGPGLGLGLVAVAVTHRLLEGSSLRRGRWTATPARISARIPAQRHAPRPRSQLTPRMVNLLMPLEPSAHLIDAARLLTAIQDPDLCLFDCRFSLIARGLGRRAYDAGHIPGAHYADLEAHLAGPIGPETGRHPLPDPVRLAAWLGACGVAEERRVVVYDDVGGAFAARLWWLLRWLGHRRVALLDGGLQAWTAVGGTLTQEVPAAVPRALQPHPSAALWVSTDALVTALDTGAVRVLDARAPERYRGEVEPIDPVAGHIPGALNRPMTGNLDGDGRFLPSAQLRERFLSALEGLDPSQIVHSCGSGVTACHNQLAMELAGLSGSRVYIGSWSAWIGAPEREIARGDA